MVTHVLDLDFQRPQTLKWIYGKQNDRNSRQLCLRLWDAGAPYTVSPGVVAVFRARKPDGTVCLYDSDEDGNTAVTIQDNQIQVVLLEQVLTLPGTVLCELNLYSPQGEKLTSFTFQLVVEQSVVTDGEVASGDYYNVLTAAIAQGAAQVQAAEEAAGMAEQQASLAQQAAQAASGSAEEVEQALETKVDKPDQTVPGNLALWGVEGALLDGALAASKVATLNDSGKLAQMPTASDVGAVPTGRMVNGKPLSGDVTLTAADMGAVPAERMVNGKSLSMDITLGPEDVGAVPLGRKVNGKLLSGDVTLTAADVEAVPLNRTINGKALSVNVALAASDVGAVPTERTVNGKPLTGDIALTASDVNAVPVTRTVNGKALSDDITLAADDVGAVPTTRTVNGKALSSNITLDADDVDAVPINYNVISGHLTRFGSLGTLVDSNITADKVQELLSPSPWIYPTIQHATVPGQGFQVRYTKTGNIVSLAGSFATWDAGETIFTLPEGYRPLGIWAFPGFDNSKDPDTVQQISINGDNGSLSVQSGGDSSTGYLYFSTSFAVRGGGIIDEP